MARATPAVHWQPCALRCGHVCGCRVGDARCALRTRASSLRCGACGTAGTSCGTLAGHVVRVHSIEYAYSRIVSMPGYCARLLEYLISIDTAIMPGYSSTVSIENSAPRWPQSLTHCTIVQSSHGHAVAGQLVPHVLIRA